MPSLLWTALVDGAARSKGLALHALSPAGPHGAGSGGDRRLTDDADLPTPRSTLAARYVRVLLTCWHCRHQRDADLQSLIDSGRGDVPLTRLRWRCAQCRSDRVDMVVTSRDRVMPWRA